MSVTDTEVLRLELIHSALEETQQELSGAEARNHCGEKPVRLSPRGSPLGKGSLCARKPAHQLPLWVWGFFYPDARFGASAIP